MKEESGMRKAFRYCKGMGLLGWLISLPLILIGLLIAVVLFYEGRKAYWDHQVREMCEKDGGVTIYEKAFLTKDEYKRLGGIKGSIPLPSVDRLQEADQYFYESKKFVINESSPEVWKSITLIKRRLDEKTLGESIHYSRRGGDIPTGILHDSSYGCPNNSNFEKQLFVIEGEL